jgi:ankyrin repeat protein
MENIKKCPICRNENLQNFLSNFTDSFLIINAIYNKTYSNHKLSDAFRNFVTYGNLEICKHLLFYYNINLNLKNEIGNEAIHSLILSPKISHEKKFEFFKYLVRRPDVYHIHQYARNYRGEYISHHAAAANHFELVEFLLSHHFYVEQTDNFNNNVLAHALLSNVDEQNILKMVKILVKKYGANIHSENTYGMSPIYLSIIFEHFTIFNYFYQIINATKHLKQNYFDRKLFLHKIISDPSLNEAKKLFSIKYLISNVQLNPNVIELKTGRTLIHCASNMGHFQIIKYLLKFTHVDIMDDNGNTALFFVIMSKNISENEKIEILNFLINIKNANPIHKNSMDGETILHVSANLGFVKIMDYLLTNTNLNLIHTVDHNGFSALFYVLGSHMIDKDKKFDILKKFIPTLNINDFKFLRDELGGTLLHRSLYNSYFAITEYLLFSTNLDMNVIDYYGHTPLAAFLFSPIEEHVKSITLKYYVENYRVNISLLTKNEDLMDYLEKSKCFQILQYMIDQQNKDE